MPRIRHTIEEINSFYYRMQGCDDGMRVSKMQGIYGMEAEDAIKELRKVGLTTEAAWMKLLIKTKEYVYFNGREIKVGDYQVFNPVTGVHTTCTTEDEAKNLMVEVANSILNFYKITVCRSISNENGDSVWSPVEIQNPYTITPNTNS